LDTTSLREERHEPEPKKRGDEEAPGKQVDALLGRVSLVLSTVTSIAALLISLSGDALSSILLLSAATALCIGCIVVLYFWIRPNRETKIARPFYLAVASSIMLLAGAWIFAFRDEIRFSPFYTSFSKAPSVIVSDSVARCLLTSKTPGTPPRRLVSFVDGLIQDAHRTRIYTGVCPDPDIALLVEGTPSDSKIVIKLSTAVPPAMPAASASAASGGSKASAETTAPDPKGLDDISRELESPQNLMANAFEEGPIGITFEAAPDELGEALKAAVHLAEAARLARIGHDTLAAPHVAAFLEQTRVLQSDPPSRGWVLEGILYAMGFYHHAGDLPRAQQAGDLGLHLFPNEPRLKVAAAYVRWSSSKSGAAQSVDLGDVDAPLADVLRGMLQMRAGDFMQASALLEKAALSLGDSASKTRRFWLDAGSAYLASVTSGDPIVRGSRITERAESALATYPQVRLLQLLDGFGTMLRGNAVRGQEILDGVRRQTHGGSLADCDYWRARAEAERRPDAAERILDPIAAGPSPPAFVLGFLAKLTWESRRSRADSDRSERLAKQALEADGDEPAANRVMGFVKAEQAPRLSRDERKDLELAALTHFNQAICREGYDADVLGTMSEIYRDLADTPRADEMGRKALEVNCTMRKDPVACRVNDIQTELVKGKVKEAKDQTKDLLAWMTSHQAVDETGQLHRIDMANRLAVAWYKSDDVAVAEELYGVVLDALDQVGDMYWKAQERALVLCNLAFVYVDERLSTKAVKTFQQALATDPTSADCEAGLAVALEQDQQGAKALRAYSIARSMDPIYGPDHLEVIRNINFWSGTAVQVLLELAGKYDQNQKGSLP
jgi:tetratricopeptide (TPR) repeat protein